MNRFEAYFARALLRRLLSRSCPARISRSGETGKAVNCFVVAVDKPGGMPHLLVASITESTIECREWDGKHYSIVRSIPLREVPPNDLFVTHYYGLSDVRYFGILQLVIGRLTFLPYFKLLVQRTRERFDTYLYIRRKLVTKQRIDLLRLLLSRHLGGHATVKAFDLMTALYTIKWVLHPEGDAQLRKISFYLDALYHSGELLKSGNEYSLSGSGLRAIEEDEEQERRHNDNVKVQRRMLWLTLMVLVFTAAQAGLFRLPMLLDLSNWRP